MQLLNTPAQGLASEQGKGLMNRMFTLGDVYE
jgi:hypothetical protein